MDVARRSISYAVSRPADVTPGPLSFSLDGLTFDARTPQGNVRVRSKLVGRPNVYNILAAVSRRVLSSASSTRSSRSRCAPTRW
jgi:UDP-N-acetylmuramyl pentapeptide synthase